jgi:large subunit ribosomal protein L5
MKRDLLYKTISPSSKGNLYSLPKISSICLNMGSNTSVTSSNQNTLSNKRKIIQILSGLEILTCQKIKRTYAKKSIASFKLRKGQCIGGMVTLRKENLFFFLEKFCFITAPKIRDFQNLQINKKEKKKASYSINFSGAPFLLYPELSNQYETFEEIKGFNVNMNLDKNFKIDDNLSFNNSTNQKSSSLLASFFIP